MRDAAARVVEQFLTTRIQGYVFFSTHNTCSEGRPWPRLAHLFPCSFPGPSQMSQERARRADPHIRSLPSRSPSSRAVTS